MFAVQFAKRNVACFIVVALILVLSAQIHADDKNGKGWLGVYVQEMTPSLVQEYETGGRYGLLVSGVVPGSPADEAGLQEEDVILAVGNRQVSTTTEFTRLIRDAAPDTTLSFLLLREGEEQELEVQIGARKIRRGFADRHAGVFKLIMKGPRLGVHVQDLNADLAPYFQVEEDAGVLIFELEEDSPAEEAGLKAGDIITQIGDEPVRNVEELFEALSDYEAGDQVTVAYLRKGTAASAEVELAGGQTRHRFHLDSGPDFRMQHWRPHNLPHPPDFGRHFFMRGRGAI